MQLKLTAKQSIMLFYKHILHVKVAILNIFRLFMSPMTMCRGKLLLIAANPQRIISQLCNSSQAL